MTEKNVTRASEKRQERILDAAQGLFFTHGIRGTTMQAIAKAAEVAKPTLYGYFADKEAVFDGFVERFIAHLSVLAEAELKGAGTPVERVANALSAKHEAAFGLLDGSPHAAELYQTSKSRMVTGIIAFDGWLHQKMVEVLGVKDAQTCIPTLKLICDCADGIARNAKHVEDIRPRVLTIVRSLLGEGSTTSS